MGLIDELFTALLFGSGAWFGLLIIVAVALLVSYTVKYSGVFFTVFLMFLGVQYLSRITNTDYLNVWFLLITWGLASLCAYLFYEDVTKKK